MEADNEQPYMGIDLKESDLKRLVSSSCQDGIKDPDKAGELVQETNVENGLIHINLVPVSSMFSQIRFRLLTMHR